MPLAFKVVRDVPVNFAVPGGGVTWDADAFAEDTTALGLSTGNGVLGFTVGQTTSYTLSLGRNESVGTMDGGIWTPLAAADTTSLSLTKATQYYLQGVIGAVRRAKLLIGYRLSVQSSSSSDSAVNVFVRGIDAAGVDCNETVALAGTSTVLCTLVLAEITSLTKDATVGSVTISDGQGYSFKLSPLQTQSRFTRVEFDTTPSEVKEMSVVYKKRIRDLENDMDAPQVSGTDEALMALTLGDLYTKQRQLAKASVKYQEGVSLLEVVRNRESVQQAQSIELVPSDLGGHTRNDFGW